MSSSHARPVVLSATPRPHVDLALAVDVQRERRAELAVVVEVGAERIGDLSVAVLHRPLDLRRRMTSSWRRTVPTSAVGRPSRPDDLKRLVPDPRRLQVAVGWSAGMDNETHSPAATVDTPPHRYSADARPGDRGALARLVGRAPHVRDAEPGRAARRSCRHGTAGREAVRARHVPVPVRRRTPRRPPARLHRHRRVRPLQADDRSQRAAHDGLRRLRAARRAVRGRDRHAPGDHDRPQRRHLPPPAAPPRPRPRPAPQRVDDRSRVLPLDAVDLQPDLQRLVRHRRPTGAPDRRADRRVRGRHPAHARRPAMGRPDRRRARRRSSTTIASPTSARRRSTGAPGSAPSSPTRRSPPTAAATAATSPCSSAACGSG